MGQIFTCCKEQSSPSTHKILDTKAYLNNYYGNRNYHGNNHYHDYNRDNDYYTCDL